MDAIYGTQWVVQMAEVLVREILELMSGIQLRHHSPWKNDTGEKRLEAIYGFVDGDYQIKLCFFAEPSLFFRLAKNMTGNEPQRDEAQEYAMEFFNILCGRFISELYKATKTSARFFPTKYEASLDISILNEEPSLSTTYFISDEQELAAFSWSATPIEDLLRRSMDG